MAAYKDHATAVVSTKANKAFSIRATPGNAEQAGRLFAALPPTTVDTLLAISLMSLFAGRGLATFKGVQQIYMMECGVTLGLKKKLAITGTSLAISYLQLPIPGVAQLGWAVFRAHIDHFQLTAGCRHLAPSAKSPDLSNFSDEHFLNVVE